MRPLPDPALSLRDTGDFVFDTELCRRALTEPTPACLAVFVRDLTTVLYRLTVSCHLPEFTDHGLHHICSLVDRISRWTALATQESENLVVNELQPSECSVLLIATLVHDIGMLSQRPEDLIQEQPHWQARGVRDVANWVRSTHIGRMEKLVRRLFENTEFREILNHPIVLRAFKVAQAHGLWPSDWGRLGFQERDAGLAAMLAVADLLDEDSNRCDTHTLLRHRLGTHLNCAHWIRHGLTADRVLIQGGRLRVIMQRPPGTDAQIEPVFRALRNHYRLVLLYLRELSHVNANILRIDFDPADGCPKAISNDLQDWRMLRGYATQSSLVYHLLNSFMPEALLDRRRIPGQQCQRLKSLGFEDVDLTDFFRIRGTLEFHSEDEQAFQALLG
jgi:hypothetical protein